VLIADDDADIRALIAHVLRTAAIGVVAEASNADETIARWREYRPDVIVLDHHMPPASGLELAERVLSEDPTQVIFLFTAVIDGDIRTQAENLGIAECISKDQIFAIPELVRTHLSPE
jgi:two-component system chemotaxis response regulator CheY